MGDCKGPTWPDLWLRSLLLHPNQPLLLPALKWPWDSYYSLIVVLSSKPPRHLFPQLKDSFPSVIPSFISFKPLLKRPLSRKAFHQYLSKAETPDFAFIILKAFISTWQYAIHLFILPIRKKINSVKTGLRFGHSCISVTADSINFCWVGKDSNIPESNNPNFHKLSKSRVLFPDVSPLPKTMPGTSKFTINSCWRSTS